MKLYAIEGTEESRGYASKGGLVTLQREWGYSQHGDEMGGRWVLRVSGFMEDWDQFRFDIAERHGLELARIDTTNGSN